MATTIPDAFVNAVLPFDSLPRASFAGFEFPCSRIEVSCSLRNHVHEYPHSPGGAPEKLGRKLYEFHFSVPLYDGSKLYPGAWSASLPSLRIIFEGGKSFDLVIPTVGTITAYCTSWKEVADPKSGRNGVMGDWSFREDQSDLFLVTNLLAQTSAGFQSNLQAYQKALADQQGRLAAARAAGVSSPDALLLAQIPSSSLSVLNQVSTGALAVLAALANAANFGYAVAALAGDLVTLCSQADDLPLWADDTRFPLLYALQDLWLSAQQLQTDALSVGVKVVEYVVPQPGMGVGAISTVIFGDSSHAIELLQINPITDPFFIPGGTPIKAFLFAPQSQGAT